MAQLGGTGPGVPEVFGTQGAFSEQICLAPVAWYISIDDQVRVDNERLDVVTGFSQPMQNGIYDAGVWQVEAVDLEPWPDIESVGPADNSSSKVLIRLSNLIPGGHYRLSVSAQVRSLAGAQAAEGGNAVIFTANLGYNTIKYKQGILRTLIDATGKAIEGLVGRPQTRLTRAFSSDDSDVVVETTVGFPDTGELVISGRRLKYSGRYGDRFLVQSVEDGVWHADESEAVQLLSRGDNGLDSARKSLYLGTAVNRDLDRLGMTLAGVGRAWKEMDDDTYREVVRALHYKAPGVPESVMRVLRALLGWMRRAEGTAQGMGNQIEDGDLAGMVEHGDLVEVDGVMLCVRKVDGNTITFMNRPGPWWEAAALEKDSHEWRLPPFIIDERTGRLDVIVYAESALLPSGYILEATDSSGEIQTGFVPLDTDSLNTGIRHIYLGYGYERSVRDMLARIRPAGVKIRYTETA